MLKNELVRYEGKKDFAVQYLKDRYRMIIAFCGFIGRSFFLYFLYNARLEPISYTVFSLILFALHFVYWDLRRTYQKYQRLRIIQQMDFLTISDLPTADSLLEQSYQQLIKKILQAWRDQRADQQKINSERDDYSEVH